MTPNEPTSDHPKVGEVHRQRLACVYVRQSTVKQVDHNRESRANQYRLVDRAQALGWVATRIQVIDSDLGLSGQSSGARTGFNTLLAEVTLGHVGIILSYEVSRLARNNSDWYRLLDLAAVCDTLIADSDGVYDPGAYNDRLLLGLKGTLSEAELHLLKLRMEAGRLSKVRRGELVQPLPTGLVRLEDGRVVHDPDEQVRHTLELVFAKFEELGSGQRVLRYLRRHQILLPRRPVAGLFRGQLLWKVPTDWMVIEVLKNPAYAGAFAYGRKRRRVVPVAAGQARLRLTRLPMDQWVHLQRDVYPAYITWDTYVRNQERLHRNGTRYRQYQERPPGAVREGAALLQGLVVCGHCGHRMHVDYTPTPRYACESLKQHWVDRSCVSVHGPAVDAVVCQAFLEALQPAHLDALEAVLATQHAEHARLEQHWSEQLAGTRYEAQLAERRYRSVEPENRLVAATLERGWEEKLDQLRIAEEDYTRFLATPAQPELTPALREQFQDICAALPALWQADRLASAHKKELLRSLIDRVVLKRVAPDRVEVKLIWVSGFYTPAFATQPTARQQDVAGYDILVDRIRQLCQEGCNNLQIAERLTNEGFHSARTSTITAAVVQEFRNTHRLYLRRHAKRSATKVDGRWTTRGLAEHLGVSIDYIQRRIRNGMIDPRHLDRDPEAEIYLIDDDPELLQSLRPRPSAATIG
jgi:DNA invertase Pin-like site-specific DNA recombinase